ncbi:MAG: DUF6785 family protein [Candidatus Hodarchaeota archaeon]
MSQEKEEFEEIEKIQGGLTPKSLFTGLLILLLWGILTIFSGNFGGAPQIFIEEMSILFPFFLLIFGLQALEKIRIRGYKFSRQELTFIWAMLIVGIPIANSGFIAGRLLLNAMFTHQDEPLSPPSGWAPTFWAPSLNEINRAYEGGTLPNIGEWLIPIGFWGITCIAWAFMCLFLIQIFRKPWVDVERLAFPLAQPVMELLEAPLAKPEAKRTRYFWMKIGAIIAIGWTSLEFLRIIFQIDPFREDFPFGIVPGRAWGVTIDFGKEFGLSALLPNAYLEARPEPVMIAAFLLVSLNVLLSGLVFYLLFWVLIPVFETEFGIIDPPTVVASPPDIDLGFARLGGISLFAFGEFGMLFGVAIWAFILQRRYIIRSLKAILDPSIIDDSGEPISYRMAWIGLAICGFIFFMSLLLSGSPITGAIYTVVFLAIGYLAGARLRAETAGMGIGHPGYLHLHGMHSARVIIGENNAATPGFYVTSMWMQFFQRDAAAAAPAISALEAYNIGRTTNTRTRDIFRAQSISVVSIILMCLIIWPILAYFYGLSNEWSGEAGHNFDYSEASLELAAGGFWDHKTYEIEIWGQVILGAIFAIGLNILRLTRPWLPLNPIAAPILLSLRGGYWWLPMLVAYLIKFGVVRIGGTKAYTNYLLPAAVGYLIGTAGLWGYTLLAKIIPSILPFLFFTALIEDIYYLLVFGIWLIGIVAIVFLIIRGLVSR